MEARKAIIKEGGTAVTSLDLVSAMVSAVDDSVSDDELRRIEESACPTCGSCSGMFTANSAFACSRPSTPTLPGNGSTLATAASRSLPGARAPRLVELCRR